MDMDTLWAFLMIMTRLGGLFIVAPLFSQRGIPVIAKSALLLTLSIVLVPVVELTGVPDQIGFQLVGAFLFEALIGLTIGLGFHLVFLAAQLAGQYIDIDLGFAMASLVDPATQTRTTIIGHFYYMFALIIFLSINGHHIMIRALIDSFSRFPPGDAQILAPMSMEMLDNISKVMGYAIRIGAPVIGSIFIINIAIGIVAKAVPQLNIFVIGFPIKTMIGLLLITITLPLTATFLRGLFANIDEFLVRVL